MKLALVFDKGRPETIGTYFERACRALRIPYDHWWLRDAQRISGPYDLYLRVDHGDYTEDLPEHLHPKIFYATDTHLPKSWRKIRRIARRYELVCCVHRDAANRLANGAWVPVGCDPELHGMKPRRRQRDLAFVGTEGGLPRKFYLQALRERYPNSFIGHAPHTELGTIYSQAKIGFNYSIRNDVNMRIFEILAGGALLITNRLPHDSLKQLGFEDRRHLVFYRNPSELIDLIDYYLLHDDEREAISKRGMTHAQRHHTYAHRLQQILRLAEGRLGVRLPTLPMSSEVLTCASS